MPDDLVIRAMTRAEVGELVGWAAREGWNPGLHDADLFWANDPQAFVAAGIGGELIGGGAITSYGGEFGFMGFFIVRPEHRGKGYGDALWHARRDRLVARLKPGATIGMDGVFAMQDYYAKGGFAFSHRNLRFRVDVLQEPRAVTEPGIVPLADISFEAVAAFDRTCFPAPRLAFLRRWIAQPDTLALGYVQEGAL
ncbi:MAG: GNAT family N-acetyltransferase, partial [Pseudomonadota bacterium]|nr:GNAT family N-acetyltransferase [Pseudomonadota bacterium]